MTTDWSGKTVMITGGASGIGAATAKRFASQGAQIIVLDLDGAAASDFAKDLGNGSEGTQLNVRDADGVDAVLSRFPTPDMLLNAAGLARGRDPLDESPVADIAEVLETNVNGTMYTCRHVLKGMRARGTGHIFNISSVAAFNPYRGAGAYGPSKAAVHMLCENLRNDVGGTLIRVTEIAPGMVQNTKFSETRYRGDETSINQTYSGMDVMTAEDIAESIYFCASQPARVNVDLMVLFPVQQHPGPTIMHRETD